MSPRLLFLLSAVRTHRALRLDQDAVDGHLAIVRLMFGRRPLRRPAPNRPVTVELRIDSHSDRQPWLTDVIGVARDFAETTRLITASS